MKKRSVALGVFLVSVAMVISVCAMPAFAKINYESDSTYDYNGGSEHFGEEIQAKMIINPVENEVNSDGLATFS